MGANVDHIRVSKLDDRIMDDESSLTVCFTYGTTGPQKTELKQSTQSEMHTPPTNHWFSGTKKKMICPQIKCEQETQIDTKSK